MKLQIRDLQIQAVDTGLLEPIARTILADEGRDIDELGLALVDDHRIQEINRAYRSLDKPTDVISFEADADEGGTLSGEVIISVPTAQRQADSAGHGLTTEVAWLFAHGVLHVLGYDDDSDAGLELMRARQRQALAAFGIEVRL